MSSSIATPNRMSRGPVVLCTRCAAEIQDRSEHVQVQSAHEEAVIATSTTAVGLASSGLDFSQQPRGSEPLPMPRRPLRRRLSPTSEFPGTEMIFRELQAEPQNAGLSKEAINQLAVEEYKRRRAAGQWPTSNGEFVYKYIWSWW